MRKLMVPAMAIGLLVGQLTASHASTFAYWNQLSGSNPGFVLTGGGPGVGKFTVTPASGTAVQFHFADFAAASLINKNVDAILTFTSSASSNATIDGLGNINQNFNLITWHITAINDANNTALGIASGANLLSGTSGMGGTVNGAIMSGQQPQGGSGGNSATFAGTDLGGGSALYNNTVTFTSDFVNFNNATNKAFGWSYTNVNPLLNLGGTFPNYYISSFVANGSGNFSALLGPAPVPEPGTLAMFVGMGISGGLLTLRRRRARA
jgi:hypothetical protein